MEADRACEAIMRDLPAGRSVQVVDADGGLQPWPETRFAAVREAIGWWVRRRELGRSRTRTDAV